MEARPLLEVRDLKQHFRLSQKLTVRAVDGVSFSIERGQTYGLVGESGSGKSTIGRSLIRLYEPTAGQIAFNGKEIAGRLDSETRRMLHLKMQMIFQDPSASLNPRRKVLDLIAEGLDINHLCGSAAERKERVFSLLERVGLSAEHALRFPHQFSGGQKQRVGIARALIMNPDLIIADEAISALDVSVQAQVVNLMKAIQRDTGIALLFISHDLSMVKYISDQIGVLHYGKLVEYGPTEAIFQNPTHPYTRSLLSAIPRPDPRLERIRKTLRYDVRAEGIDYGEGEYHQAGKGHFVLATGEQFSRWSESPWNQSLEANFI
ncbi:MAG: ATP-binding cassette domain-containing protein [Christensenellaceae bacterium]|jgi:oligopeptide transport system ATP-binding protein|nr:ATP-binding cassette domain-containing protein [Christensenellaceae bacterium]